MAYSEIEQHTRDIDIFFHDNEKTIHIATGGGQIPKRLAENDINNEEFWLQIIETSGDLEVEINPNLAGILGLSDNGLENYLVVFIQMAQRGFYSYDKSNVGNFEDKFFHLVARPKLSFSNIMVNGDKLLRINQTLPQDFTSFNLFEYFQ